MKIIGINTSPRENSNSKIALEKALDTAESKGADVKIFDLNNMNIKTCQACDYCVEHKGECSLDDDMQEIYNEIKDAYGIIIATPIYMGNVSSLAKIFIDRFYAVMNSLDTYNVHGKKFSVIASQAAVDPPMYEYIKHNLETTVDIFRGIGFDVEDVELLIGNAKEAIINTKEDQINKAIMIGNKIVR
ncbi:flavodoxin family protein [Methanosphaera sp.]|uniref:flavodoxin family protein n=1 Tax=Methanosphaera sp. TaxID=2666342 RepID=UPI0025D73547|nr:flavodoxin family protein [Methanosphaera sp.]MEE1118070.1 flavodoxin family protein [Methanosphaera sp.]